MFFPEIRNRRLQQEALQHLIQLLPTPNRETLWALLNFLSLVAANSEDQKNENGEWIPGNKMDATNLATVSTTSHLILSLFDTHPAFCIALCASLTFPLASL